MEQLMTNLSKSASPSEPPHCDEIREIPEMRNLAVMATEHSCFTNSMVAVVNAYQAGWSARDVRPEHRQNEKCKFCGDAGKPLDEYGYCTACIEGMRRTNGD